MIVEKRGKIVQSNEWSDRYYCAWEWVPTTVNVHGETGGWFRYYWTGTKEQAEEAYARLLLGQAPVSVFNVVYGKYAHKGGGR